MKTTNTLLAAVTSCTLLAGSATAGTINSAVFDVDPSSTSVNTTGPGYQDWGTFLPNGDFLDETQGPNADFDTLTGGNGTVDPATNSKATPGIGTVTITERDAAEYSNGNTGLAWEFTVNDGTQLNGTYNPLGAANGIAGGEDIFTITFNDLTTGTTTVTLYMDHTNTGRTFEAAVDLQASDGNDATGLFSPAISGSDGDGYFTFSVEVTNAVAGSDLSISIDSNSGGSGQFQFAGYTVFNLVPEPSSLALLGLGGLLIARRRRG